MTQLSQLVRLRLAVDTVGSQYQALSEEDEDVGYKYVRDAGLQTYESYGCPVIDDYSDALAVLTSSYHPVVITEQRFPRDIFGEVLGSLCGQCETWFKPLVYVGGATAPCPVCYIQSALEDDHTSSKVLPLKKTRNNGAPAAGCGGSSVADKNHDTGMSITPGAATRSTAAEHAKKKEEEEKLKAVSERRRLEEEERKVDEVDFEPLPARVIVPLSPVQTKVMQSLFPDATNANETLQHDPSETTNTTSRRSNRIAVIEDAVHASKLRLERNLLVRELPSNTILRNGVDGNKIISVPHKHPSFQIASKLVRAIGSVHLVLDHLPVEKMEEINHGLDHIPVDKWSQNADECQEVFHNNAITLTDCAGTGSLSCKIVEYLGENSTIMETVLSIATRLYCIPGGGGGPTDWRTVAATIDLGSGSGHTVHPYHEGVNHALPIGTLKYHFGGLLHGTESPISLHTRRSIVYFLKFNGVTFKPLGNKDVFINQYKPGEHQRYHRDGEEANDEEARIELECRQLRAVPSRDGIFALHGKNGQVPCACNGLCDYLTVMAFASPPGPIPIPLPGGPDSGGPDSGGGDSGGPFSGGAESGGSDPGGGDPGGPKSGGADPGGIRPSVVLCRRSSRGQKPGRDDGVSPSALSLPREVGVALDAAVREILGGTERQGSSVQSDPSRCLVTVDDGSGSGWGLHRRRINSVTAWLRNSGYAALCSRQGTTAGFGDAATAILVPAISAPGCGNTVLHCSTSGGRATSKDLVISNASFLFNKDLDRPADAAVQAFHSDAFTSADTEFVAGNFQARTLLRCVQRAQQQRDPLLQFVGDIAEYFPPVTSNPSVRTAVLIQLDATWESLKLLASMGGQIAELLFHIGDKTKFNLNQRTKLELADNSTIGFFCLA